MNAVAPGAIWSSGTQTHYPKEALEAASRNQPIHRLGTVEEVSNVALFLASKDLSGFTTGQTWYVGKRSGVLAACTNWCRRWPIAVDSGDHSLPIACRILTLSCQSDHWALPKQPAAKL